MKINRLLPFLLISAFPVTAFAAADPLQGFKSLNDIVKVVTEGVLTSLVGLFAVAAMAAFFFGIVKFILAARNGVEKDMTNGKQFMLWGVIALFVMFSVWGIVKYGQTIFGVTGNDIVIPKILIDGASSSKSPASSALPTPGSQTTSAAKAAPGASNGNANGCTALNQKCVTSSGVSGFCEYGNAAQGNNLSCAPDNTCLNISDPATCTSLGCNWRNDNEGCTQ